MHPTKIVLCYPVTRTQRDQIEAAAGGPGSCEVVDAGQERIAAELPSADIYCGHAKVPVDWDQIVLEGRLRWIQSSAAGIDHCLTPPVAASSIPITSAAGLFADQVAEQTMALLLALIRSMPTFFRAQQAHVYERRPTADLREKRIGIVGFGGNGQRLARVLSVFKTRIVAFDLLPERLPRPAYVENLLDVEMLDDWLPSLDIVILCVPLTDRTRRMFAAQRIGRMRQGSLLVNVARGECVVESALVDALQSGHLHGAGLDVAEREPLDALSPLWNMENVVITPHVGAQGFDRYQRVTDFFCENLQRFRAGRPLLNLVDKERGF